MFRRMADDPANASFPFGALEFLPGITRGLIQYIGSLQENIGEIKMKNAELQTIQNKFQGETETNINWLQDENKSPKMDTEASLDIIRRLQKKNDKLEDEIEDLRRDFIKKKQLYTSMKAEKESLENQLNVVKSGMAGDSDDQNPRKKHSRIE
ncbi:predicted protein [Sclerotinia sclerotiorum 1980 UF-70]|uniref:Uncharacterized protein n=2 Tax=Sclerotinia sclerotiorum (strain ATCC 18683 / 1980 / Ss-1) TaxID=665079 RepID=A7ERP8_SCLS1|nr:predicted protein [Sclerotinia sclerotiorum 1980 UF-70]APA13398.1 hypothetical protein sscle_11g081680 [Sclerotinia sclerotiorum 1980 UF-70]EDN92140.1 predicted protein [Sclerotinia sclerotiorum 1980 UF-70]